MTRTAEDFLVGAICAVVSLLLVRRIAKALQSGEVPLYRTRLTRAEAGDAKFFALVGLNVLAFVAMFVIAADLLFGLDLRG